LCLAKKLGRRENPIRWSCVHGLLIPMPKVTSENRMRRDGCLAVKVLALSNLLHPTSLKGATTELPPSDQPNCPRQARTPKPSPSVATPSPLLLNPVPYLNLPLWHYSPPAPSASSASLANDSAGCPRSKFGWWVAHTSGTRSSRSCDGWVPYHHHPTLAASTFWWARYFA